MNKIVIYRSKFNAEPPRSWKRFTNNKPIDILKKLEYNIIEIDYRTPIREVMYHISTAEMVIGYDGMWHHVVQLFFKPFLILSNDNITKFFTPGAYMVSNGKESNYINFIKKLHYDKIDLLYEKAKSYEKSLKDEI